MQKHSQHNKDEQTQFFRKIYLSLYSKGLRKDLCVRGELETEQRLQNIDLHSSGYSSISFLFSWAAQPGAWGPSLCWDLVLTLRTGTLTSNSDLQLIWTSCHIWLYNCLTSTCFLWASHLHSIQPVDSQGYPLISLTGAPVIYTGAFLIWELGRVGGQYVIYWDQIVNALPNTVFIFTYLLHLTCKWLIITIY